MRNPVDAKAEAALDEARGCLRAIQQRGCLEPDEEYEDAAERAHALYALLNATISDDARDWWLHLADQPRPPKPGAPSNRRRDFWITCVIKHLVDEYDLTPTRSRASEAKYQQQLTACGIVARALSELGIRRSEATIDVIWSRRDKWHEIKHDVPTWWYLSPKTAKYMSTLLKHARSPVQ